MGTKTAWTDATQSYARFPGGVVPPEQWARSLVRGFRIAALKHTVQRERKVSLVGLPASPPLPPSPPCPFLLCRMKYGLARSVIHKAFASSTSSGFTHMLPAKTKAALIVVARLLQTMQSPEGCSVARVPVQRLAQPTEEPPMPQPELEPWEETGGGSKGSRCIPHRASPARRRASTSLFPSLQQPPDAEEARPVGNAGMSAAVTSESISNTNSGWARPAAAPAVGGSTVSPPPHRIHAPGRTRLQNDAPVRAPKVKATFVRGPRKGHFARSSGGKKTSSRLLTPYISTRSGSPARRKGTQRSCVWRGCDRRSLAVAAVALRNGALIPSETMLGEHKQLILTGTHALWIGAAECRPEPHGYCKITLLPPLPGPLPSVENAYTEPTRPNKHGARAHPHVAETCRGQS